jgi:hypothetical protein
VAFKWRSRCANAGSSELAGQAVPAFILARTERTTLSTTPFMMKSGK